MMKVPLLDLKQQISPIRDAILAELTQVLDSTQYIMGPKVEKFEAEIAAYLNVPFALGVSSGTDALLLALMGLKIGHGDLVITSDFSFFATAGVIARVGATPLFVDIDLDTFNLSAESLLQTLKSMNSHDLKRVKAIIPVHLYGQCADMGELLKISSQYGIPLIEDAAQALGTSYLENEQEKQAGTMGLMGCYSFFPSKNLGCLGDAGLLVTYDKSLFERLKILRVHGAEKQYIHLEIGGNFRLDPIQAVVLSVKLPFLNQWHEGRARNAAHYRSGLQSLPPELLKCPENRVANKNFPRTHIYNQFTLKVKNRDSLKAYLEQNGIASAIYYPLPFHRQPCFANLGYHEQDFPYANEAASDVLSLPIFPELQSEQLDYVIDKIKQFYLA